MNDQSTHPPVPRGPGPEPPTSLARPSPAPLRSAALSAVSLACVELYVSRIIYFLKTTISRSKNLVLSIPWSQWDEIFEMGTPQNPQQMVDVTVSLWKKTKSLSPDSMLAPPEERAGLWLTHRARSFSWNQQLIPQNNSYVLLGKNPESSHSRAGTDRWDLGERGEGVKKRRRRRRGIKGRDRLCLSFLIILGEVIK